MRSSDIVAEYTTELLVKLNELIPSVETATGLPSFER